MPRKTPRRFECGSCRTFFPTRTILQDHHRELPSHRVRAFKCTVPTCIRAFFAKQDLQRHVDEYHHLGSKNFSCSSCSVSFARQSQLNRHWKGTRCQRNRPAAAPESSVQHSLPSISLSGAASVPDSITDGVIASSYPMLDASPGEPKLRIDSVVSTRCSPNKTQSVESVNVVLINEASTPRTPSINSMAQRSLVDVGASPELRSARHGNRFLRAVRSGSRAMIHRSPHSQNQYEWYMNSAHNSSEENGLEHLESEDSISNRSDLGYNSAENYSGRHNLPARILTVDSRRDLEISWGDKACPGAINKMNRDPAKEVLDINEKVHGNTALCHAITGKQIELNIFLLKLGREPDIEDLYYAIDNNLKIVLPRVCALISLKATGRFAGRGGPHCEVTPLQLAVWLGHEEAMKMLLSRKDINVNWTNGFDGTALHLAVLCGHERITKLLLKQGGIDVNLSGTVTMQTPLHVAVQTGRVSVVTALLNHDHINVNSEDQFGDTPLFCALQRYGTIEMLRLLVKSKKVDLGKRGRIGRMALHLAAVNGGKRAIRLIFEHLEPPHLVNSVDSIGQTALHRAASVGNDAVVKAILDKAREQLYYKDETGSMPIHLAAWHARRDTIHALLEQDLGLMDSRDKLGRTPLHLAAAGGHEIIVRDMLALSRNRVDVLDHAGNTAKHLASFEGHTRIVTMLDERELVEMVTMRQW